MPGTAQKIRRIKARLSGDPDDSVEVPFEITCDCGEAIRGVRRSSFIEKDCDHCGQWHYVLPANVYPATRSVESEIIGGSFSHRLMVVVGEILPARKKATDDTGSKATSTDEATTDTDADAVAVEAELPVPKRRSLPRINPKALLRKTFTPFRMVMLAIAGVVAGTGYWVTTQRSAESAQRIWLDSARTVEDLLTDKDFIGLESTLTEAVAAGKTIGKDDAEWRQTLNLLGEVRAANQLASEDLLSAIQDSYDKDGGLKNSGSSALQSVAASGIFIFDSWIQEDFEDAEVFLFELPAAPGRHNFVMSVRLPQLRELLDTNGENRRVLFAARIAEIVHPKETPMWRVTLDLESFVLLTNESVCAEVGLTRDVDPELPELLDRQSEFVQSSSAWDSRPSDLYDSGAS